ncbi:MAG TPA: ABC transporter permease [Dehalococcoidia bacterium]|nr:ABC transporter permease [Dehalococcoidia bacterium]
MTTESVASGARIIDRGYQHYAGPRHGVGASLVAIAAGTMKRSLGFKRPTTAKILPFAIVLLAMAPALIALGVRMIFPVNDFRGRALDNLVPYTNYLSLLSTELLLMTALSAPEALCPDRRQRVLSLYYASPVRPLLYLLAQAVAVAIVMLLITLVPLLFLWSGNVLLADSPGAYLKDHVHDALSILGAGFLLAGFYAGVGLAVSSLTERRAYAAGSIIGGAFILAAITSIVRERVHASWAPYAVLLDPINLPRRAMRWIFGRPDLGIGIHNWVYVAAMLVITLLAFGLVVRAYRSLDF